MAQQQRSALPNGKLTVWLVAAIFGIGQVITSFCLKEVYQMHAQVEAIRENRFTSSDGLQLKSDMQARIREETRPKEWIVERIQSQEERLRQCELMLNRGTPSHTSPP